MDIEVIERLIALVERSRVTELDFSEGGSRLRILRQAEPPPAASPVAPTPAAAASPDAGPAATSPPTTSLPAEPAHVIPAGMFGTFFRASAPGQPPFVAEGDRIAEGQTLGILEAMKMLNPVEADRAGRILRILVADGASVEAGAPLFVLDVAG